MAKSRLEPKDFEACLYPLVQRELANKKPANCWEVRVSPQDARALTLAAAARFAYDALEHFALEQPELGPAYVKGVLVVASADARLGWGRVSASARSLDSLDMASRKARAVVLGEGVAVGCSCQPRYGEEKGTNMGWASLMDGLKRKAKGGPSEPAMQRLNPVALIDRTIDELEANAMVWPDGKDFPPNVTVYVSQADYAYYGPNRQANERRLEDEIVLYAQECGALLEQDPRVYIKVDPLLYGGQLRVETAFDEPASRVDGSARASGFSRANGPARANDFSRATDPVRTSGSARAADPVCVTPAFASRGADALRTPEYDARQAGGSCAMAKLTSSFFQAAVLPNDTVGRLRYGDSRPAPTVKLDGPEFEFVSHEQGVFGCDADGWSFTSFGRNGTSVQRKGAWLKLEHGQRFPLESGDCISFGKSAPLTFTVIQ
ncbi:MAG: DUF3662 domain-containing protein [Eggerthellaceae bacterium]|nr:DUF3662 domain-containing protein [Eggerthellaceae bacterium]